MYGGGIIDQIDAIDLDAVRAQHAGEQAPTKRTGAGQVAPDELPTDSFPGLAFEEPARLLLVPCNRPADAITALGGVAGETDSLLVSAMLRCWEQHHAAILYEVAPSLIRLNVNNPPQDINEASVTATELRAILADDDHRSVDDLADELLGRTAGPSLTAERPLLGRDRWDIGV